MRPPSVRAENMKRSMPEARRTPPPVDSPKELLLTLIQRSRGGLRPSNAEVEEALELGATSLITLEARLQAVNSKRAAMPDHEAELEREDLMKQITSLLEALEDLRSCAEADMPSPLAHGFVLGNKSPKHNE